MKTLGANSALVIWDQERLATHFSEDLWTELRDTLNQNREEFDDACLATQSCPIPGLAQSLLRGAEQTLN